MDTILQALVFIVGSVMLALAGAIHVRRHVPLAVQIEQNEVAGFFIAVLGVVYGVLLAFAVVVVWEDFEEARSTVESEANSVGDIYSMAEGLPEPARQAIQEQAIAYARVVVDDEWPMLRQGHESVSALRESEALWSAVRAYEPSGAREAAIYDKLLEELQDVNDERRMRLLQSRDGIPPLIWGILIGGGVVTVLFTYFFGLKNFRAHLAMTTLYVASIAFVLFLIAAVDYPFSGTVHIRPDAFELVIQRIETLESARQ